MLDAVGQEMEELSDVADSLVDVDVSVPPVLISDWLFLSAKAHALRAMMPTVIGMSHPMALLLFFILILPTRLGFEGFAALGRE